MEPVKVLDDDKKTSGSRESQAGSASSPKESKPSENAASKIGQTNIKSSRSNQSQPIKDPVTVIIVPKVKVDWFPGDKKVLIELPSEKKLNEYLSHHMDTRTWPRSQWYPEHSGEYANEIVRERYENSVRQAIVSKFAGQKLDAAQLEKELLSEFNKLDSQGKLERDAMFHHFLNYKKALHDCMKDTLFDKRNAESTANKIQHSSLGGILFTTISNAPSSKSTKAPETIQFPSKEELIPYLEKHPSMSRQGERNYFKDKGFINAVAQALGGRKIDASQLENEIGAVAAELANKNKLGKDIQSQYVFNLTFSSALKDSGKDQLKKNPVVIPTPRPVERAPRKPLHDPILDKPREGFPSDPSRPAQVVQFPSEKELTKYLEDHKATKPTVSTFTIDEFTLIERVAKALENKKIEPTLVEDEVESVLEKLYNNGDYPNGLAGFKQYIPRFTEALQEKAYELPKKDSEPEPNLQFPEAESIQRNLRNHPYLKGARGEVIIDNYKEVFNAIAEKLGGREIPENRLWREVEDVLEKIQFPKGKIDLDQLNVTLRAALKDSFSKMPNNEPNGPVPIKPVSNNAPVFITPVSDASDRFSIKKAYEMRGDEGAPLLPTEKKLNEFLANHGLMWGLGARNGMDQKKFIGEISAKFQNMHIYSETDLVNAINKIVDSMVKDGKLKTTKSAISDMKTSLRDVLKQALVKFASDANAPISPISNVSGGIPTNGPSTTRAQSQKTIQFPEKEELITHLKKHDATKPFQTFLAGGEMKLIEKIASKFGGKTIDPKSLERAVEDAFKEMTDKGEYPKDLNGSETYVPLFLQSLKASVNHRDTYEPEEMLRFPVRESLATSLKQHPEILKETKFDPAVIDEVVKKLGGKQIDAASLRSELAEVLQNLAEKGKLPKGAVALDNLNATLDRALRDVIRGFKIPHVPAPIRPVATAPDDPYAYLYPNPETMVFSFGKKSVLLAGLKAHIKTAGLDPSIHECLADHLRNISVKEGHLRPYVKALLLQLGEKALKGREFHLVLQDLMEALPESASMSIEVIDSREKKTEDRPFKKVRFEDGEIPSASNEKKVFPAPSKLLLKLMLDKRTSGYDEEVLKEIARKFGDTEQTMHTGLDVATFVIGLERKGYFKSNVFNGESFLEVDKKLTEFFCDSELATDGETPAEDDRVAMLEEKAKNIRALRRTIEGESVDIDWGKLGLEAGKQIANAVADYYQDKAKHRRVAADVRKFIDNFEREMRALNREIPKEPDALRSVLESFAERVQPRPEVLGETYENLKKSDGRLNRDLEELRSREAALLLEQGKEEKNLREQDRLARLHKKALAKALKSGKRAGKKTGLFSNALHAIGGVLAAIPTPVTMAVGGSLVAVTSAAKSAVSANTDKILGNRTDKYQRRLNDTLENRQNTITHLRDIDSQLSAIEATYQTYEEWILSQDSVGQLTVEERLKQLIEINVNRHKAVDDAQGRVDALQSQMDKITTTMQATEQWLAGRRAEIPLLPSKQQKKAWGTYNGVVAQQTKQQQKLDNLKTEKDALVENELEPAQEAAKKNDETLAKEEALKPLALFREALLEEFAKSEDGVPSPDSFAHKTLLKYNEGLQQQLATTMNVLNAGGALARELYFAGHPLLYHASMFLHNSVNFYANAKLLDKSYKQWQVNGRALDGDNFFNDVLVPGLQLLGTAVGIYNAFTAVKYLLGQYLSGGEKEKSLLECIHEDTGQHIQRLAQWMDNQFDYTRRMLGAQHKELLKNIEQMRFECHALSDEVLSRIESNHLEIMGEFKDQRFDDHVERVNDKSEMFARAWRKLEYSQFLGVIEVELVHLQKSDWNGLKEEHAIVPHVQKQSKFGVELKLVYKKPTYFTGLLAKGVGLSNSFPNYALLSSIKGVLFEASAQLKAQPEAVKKQFESIVAQINAMDKELIGLFDFIEPLVASLYAQQKKLSTKLQENQKASKAAKEKYQQSLLTKALNVFEGFAKSKLLGSDRAYLSKVAKTSFIQMMPDFDLANLSGYNFSGMTSLVGKDLFTFGVSLAVPPLAVANLVWRGAAEVSLLVARFQMDQLVTRPLIDQLRPLNEPSQSMPQNGYLASISTTEVNKPLETKVLGINLRERKVVQIKPNETNTHSIPFLVCGVWLRCSRYYPGALHYTLSLADRLIVTIDELRKIDSRHTTNDFEKADLIKVLMDALFQLYQSKIETTLPISKLLTDKFGEHEFLTSDDPYMIPLAFPKQLLDALEENIAEEKIFVESARLGNFVPKYEFSPDSNTLMIVYSLVSPEGVSSTPYCKFVIAQFDTSTTVSFQTEFNEQGLPETQLKAANEFLVQALYGGFLGLGLPGDETLVLKSGHVAPKDRWFPGLYQILKKDPTAGVLFNSTSYTQEEEDTFKSWIFASGDKVPDMICQNTTRYLTPEAFGIHRKLQEAKKKMLSRPLYEQQYYLLMGLIKLFSRCENEKFLGCLQATLLIYPPEECDVVVHAGQLPEDVEDSILDFVDLLEETPSEEKLALFNPLLSFIASAESATDSTPEKKDSGPEAKNANPESKDSAPETKNANPESKDSAPEAKNANSGSQDSTAESKQEEPGTSN